MHNETEPAGMSYTFAKQLRRPTGDGSGGRCRLGRRRVRESSRAVGSGVGAQGGGRGRRTGWGLRIPARGVGRRRRSQEWGQRRVEPGAALGRGHGAQRKEQREDRQVRRSSRPGTSPILVHICGGQKKSPKFWMVLDTYWADVAHLGGPRGPTIGPRLV